MIAVKKDICSCCGNVIDCHPLKVRDKNYHLSCFVEKVSPICCICHQPIGYSSFYNDHWGNVAHARHSHDDLQWCSSCGRLFALRSPLNQKSLFCLCPQCDADVVSDSAHIERCRQTVLDIYSRYTITGIPSNIPIYLKEPESMKGCLGTCRTTTAGGKIVDCHIDIVKGLPETEFIGVLAHEMLHYWLIRYARKTTKEENEGFCNLGQALVLTALNTGHSDYLLLQLYQNKDEVYGDGYRMLKMRLEKMNVRELLKSLKK